MYDLILGKGFVGNSLARHFRAISRPYKLYSQNELNYTDIDKLRIFLLENEHAIRSVIITFGLTGIPNVDFCEDNKELCYRYNVLYPLEVIKLCHAYAIPVIYVGSGCIYTGYERAYTEQDTPNFGIFSDESSYYSKCKHIFETVAKNYRCYILRIRIPFTPLCEPKNYFNKLLKYDNLINTYNSVTSITDFSVFVHKLLSTRPAWGIYNVVNPSPIKAEDVTHLLKAQGIQNPNWNFIEVEDLNTKAKRSNCILSTEKIKSCGLELPDTYNSLIRDIKMYAESYTTT